MSEVRSLLLRLEMKAAEAPETTQGVRLKLAAESLRAQLLALDATPVLTAEEIKLRIGWAAPESESAQADKRLPENSPV